MTCRDCHRDFEMSDAERRWYARRAAERGWDANACLPRRCADCRRKRRDAGKLSDKDFEVAKAYRIQRGENR